MSIDMVRSPDVLASVAKLVDGPFTVGFAAETDRVREYALGKLKSKKLDMIAANEVGDGRAFGQDDNALHVFWPGGERSFATAPKQQLANELIALVGERFAAAPGKGNVTELPTAAAKD